MTIIIEYLDTTTLKTGKNKLIGDNLYVWFHTYGNFGCDCNRHHTFLSQEEVEKLTEDEPECGDSRFKICSIYKYGEVIYSGILDSRKKEYNKLLELGFPEFPT